MRAAQRFFMGTAAVWAAMALQVTTRAGESPTTRPADAEATTFVPVPEEKRGELPPPRTRDKLRQIIGKGEPQSDPRPLRIVLVGGPKDHGPGEHDYPAWQKAWTRLLEGAPKTRVTSAWEKPSADDLKSADVLVFFKHFAWPPELNEQIDAFLARGGGMVFLHFAVDGNNNPESVGKHLGLFWGQGAKFRHGWLELLFEDKPAEPFLRGLTGRKLRFHDESYWRLTGDPATIDVLASGMEDEDGKQVRIPLIWNRQSGKGRVHVNILGHYNWTFNDPLFRVLVLRGISWAAGEPVDRLAPLATIDVTFKD